MMTVDKFKKEIQGEKLLFQKKGEYSIDEINLILETVSNRLSHNLYYMSLITGYIPTLTSKVLPNVSQEEYQKEVAFINREVERRRRLPGQYAREESDYGDFFTKKAAGIRCEDSYFDVIKDMPLDADRLERILDDGVASLLGKPDEDLLITANLMFVRYPEFYTDERVLNLTHLLYTCNKEHIDGDVSLERRQVAKKATLGHIKEYTKKRNKEKREAKRLVKKNKKNQK